MMDGSFVRKDEVYNSLIGISSFFTGFVSGLHGRTKEARGLRIMSD